MAKDELETLFPGVKLGEVTVKPWSFNQLIEAIPILVSAYEILEVENIDFKSLEAMATQKDVAGLSINLMSLMKVIPKIRKPILELAKITTGCETEEIGEMDFGSVFSIVLLTMIQNSERIKNFLGLGKTAMQSLMG